MMSGRTNEHKCNICGRGFNLKSSLEVHIPVHKNDGVLLDKGGESTSNIDSSPQTQGKLLEFLEKEDMPLKCKYCGKVFTLRFCLKTHVIDCKAKSSQSCSNAEISSVECTLPSLDLSPLDRDESEDENLMHSSHFGGRSKSEKETEKPSCNSERPPLVFSLNSVKPDCLADTELQSSTSNEGTEKYSLLSKKKVVVLKVKKKEKSKKVKKKPSLPASDSVNRGSAHSKSNGKQQPKTSDQSVLCEICGKSFSKKSLLSVHMKYHTGKFTCSICDKICVSQYNLSQHYKAHKHSEEKVTCQYCSLKFVSKSSVKRHIKGVHLGLRKDTVCDICGNKFRKSYLATHRRIHTGERPYQCEVCGASFVQQHHLKTHMTVHTNQERYPCKECDKVYKNKDTFRNHLLKHFGDKEKLSEECPDTEIKRCSHCDKGFLSYTLLRHHEWNHVNNKKSNLFAFDCTYCGKKFRQLLHKVHHERIHTGEKPLKCSYCEKSFRLPNARKSHERIHTGERPFACKECGKTFVQRQHMTAHMILHTGEKPFCCSYCGKAFANKSNLSSHRKLHLKKNEAQ